VTWRALIGWPWTAGLHLASHDWAKMEPALGKARLMMIATS
jgi:hypothetical protein